MELKDNKISLNGEWDFMPIYDKDEITCLPEKIAYEKEKVFVPSSWRSNLANGSFSIEKYDYNPMDTFGYPKEWNNAEAGVLHRKFTLSKEKTKNNRIFLKFDAIAQYSVIILNNVVVSKYNEEFLPLEIEVTDIIKEENEIYVLCSSFKNVTIQSGLKKKVSLQGSWYGGIVRGIWQDAMIIARPLVYICDKEIITSVRNKKIDVNVYVDTNNKSGNYTIQSDIFNNNGEMVKSIAQTFCTSEKICKVSFSQVWDDPIYWDCENPYLYNMKLSLKEECKVIYSSDLRFGFREFWAEGDKFILNGTRVNLRGDSWHFQGAGQQTKQYALNWCRLCKEHGANSIRYHAEPHPEYYLDAADEMGILIVDETAIYGSGKTMDASHDEYIENCEKHIVRFVKRDKNHPSVVIWSLQNEMRWVDGRDTYKLHIPHFMDTFKENDPQNRLISLDGDNRLISKENTQIASLHYNIDGTINQWDRKQPLTIGEHGGLWYISPQNSSMYLGLKVYQDNAYCEEGISLKEQLFMEYARLQQVSGISSFNFAHYFSHCMPDKDIEYPTLEKENNFGIHPKTIKKYSLTIDNGFLKDEGYPYYTPNATCKYATDGMRPITIIMSEYNTGFYDDSIIEKTLNIFNDTMNDVNAKIIINVTNKNNDIYNSEFSYFAVAGEFYTKKVSFSPPKVAKKETLILKAKITHNDCTVYTYEKSLFVFPSSLKNEPITKEKVCYFGNKDDYAKLLPLVPNLVNVESFENVDNKCKLLILGSNLAINEDSGIRNYFDNGGRIMILPQFSYSLGEMTINKMEFLRAHASDYSHSVLKDLDDDDFIFWNEAVYEEGPEPFIHSAFEKPINGNYNMLLECSFGDFNDGGDLWTPLLEYTHNDATVIACQLDIMKNFNKTPQASILTRNMINYLISKKTKTIKTGAFVCKQNLKFLEKLDLKFESSNVNNLENYDIIVADAKAIRENISNKNLITQYIKAKKKLFILPLKKEDEGEINLILQSTLRVEDRCVYELICNYDKYEVKGVSIPDMFGYDKPGMSPRETQNRHIAFDCISEIGSEILMESIEGNPWEDLFIYDLKAEYCKRAVVRFNKDFQKEPKPYYIKKDNTYICQFALEENYDKSVRMYSKLLSNLGCEFNSNKMNFVKAEPKYAMEMIMSLPYLEYQDYNRAIEYYSDAQFSLNNLGEGLYGWMKKYERDNTDGYFKLHDTKNKKMFITSFVHLLCSPADENPKDTQEYILDLDINCDFTLYINGKIQNGKDVTLLKGINRFFMLANVENEELQFRAVFKKADGTFADNLLYRVTVDEVDPK